jgi:hypothetical protein
MAYAYNGPDWIEITGPFVIGTGEAAVSYPANWPEMATPAQLASVGICEIVEPAALPAGQVEVSRALQDVGGQPHRVVTHGAAPPPPATLGGLVALLVSKGIIAEQEAEALN